MSDELSLSARLILAGLERAREARKERERRNALSCATEPLPTQGTEMPVLSTTPAQATMFGDEGGKIMRQPSQGRRKEGVG